ncbi:hypothetical protein Tco_1070829 [Tanacetum coccineum]|uniref:Synaptobrevin, longin-like domain protein n=1 Tax=Tanacetum coccineum TaxID=301880 RepID=A0ABQ5HPB7_9ASTR
MAELEFVDQHNMVACLEKTGGNSEFHEIVDFLTSGSIHHALTVSPTIYISYIEQFWNTASSQTVNDEKQIHATVDSKAVVVTEASIRSSLLLNDADGTACLTNEAIFQNLALMGYEGELNKLTFQKALFSPQWKYLIHTILHCLSSKSTSWNEFSTNIASAVICLATNQKFNFSKLIFDGMLRNLDNPKKKFLMYPRFLMVFLNNQIELGEPFNDVYITPAHTLKVFSNMSRKGVKFSGKVTLFFDFMLLPHQAPEGEDSKDSLEGTNRSEGDQVKSSYDSNLSGDPTSDSAKGSMTLEELSVICTNLSNRVLALEASKDAQAAQIIKLKTRNKKLKKKSHPIIAHHRAWLRSVSRLSMKRQLGRKDSVSKQGRKNVKPKPTLDDSTFDDLDADHVSTATPITPPTTTSVFEDEDIFLVDALVMLSDKTKLKGVAIKDVKESHRPERSILTLKPLPSIDPKDKDAEVARLVYEEELAELEKEKEERERQEQAYVDYIANLYDEVQAKMDASKELVARQQMEEREMYTVEERSRLLAEYFENRKKQLVAERSAAIRNKPPTRTQLRNLMMTYLKHTGRYKHAQLNKKILEEIQALYIKEQERAADFVPIGSEKDERMIEKMNKKASGVDEEEVLEEPDSTKVEVKQEGNTESTRKRPGRRLKMKATKKSKRQKTDSDLEEEEQLKAFLMIVPDEEGEINYEVLNRRYPIVDWESKFYHTDRYGKPHDYYRVFRADGSSRYIKTFTEMVSRFDRLDFIELHSLVMKRFETSTPEGIDLILWGSLRTMFEANAEDDLWKNQEEWILKSWNFYDNCGVHILVLEDGTEFYMLAERSKLMNLEAMMEVRRIFKCWFYNHTTNGHQFTISNRHQELASPEQTASELASPEQMALSKDFSNPLIVDTLAIPEQTATGKPISNLFMAGSLPKTTKPTSLVLLCSCVAEILRCVDMKHDEIEWKNFPIANDNLIADYLSKEVFYVATNSELNVSSFTEMHDAHTSLKARCLELKVELSNLRDKIQKDNHNKLVKRFSNLEIMCANHLEQTTALLTKNESLKVQIQNKLSCVNKDHVKPKVLTPGKYAIDVEPIPPRNRNNREVHLVYLKHLKESVETLREIEKKAKVERPLDSLLASACLYTKHS